MPVDVLGWRLIEAITGVSYPFPTPGSVPYFNPNDPEAGPKEAQPQGKEGVDFFPSAATLEKDKDKGKKGKAGEEENGNGNGNGDDNDLESNTVDQLKDIAEDEDVDLTGIHRKDDIIEAIREKRKEKGE
jgi:hypothetical protein